jgi:hypothetical protein
MEAATALATERRSDIVHGFHLLHALTGASEGPVAELLARYGSSAATVNARWSARCNESLRLVETPARTSPSHQRETRERRGSTAPEVVRVRWRGKR